MTVPDTLISTLTKDELYTYIVCKREKGFLSQTEVAKRAGLPRESARRILRKLSEQNLIVWAENGQVSGQCNTNDNQQINSLPKQAFGQKLGSLTEEDKALYLRYEKCLEWMGKNCPRVLKMKRPLQFIQFKTLLEIYGIEAMIDVFVNMDDRPDLLEKHLSAYLTARNWLNRRNNDNRTT